MKISDIVGLTKDTKVNIEIIEKASGASFGFYDNRYVPKEFMEKEVMAINVQYLRNSIDTPYINGKKILIIEI